MEFTGPKPTGISRQSKPITERRHSVRLRVHSPAYANLDESSQGNAGDLNEILDISEEGISIQTTSPLAVDRALNLNLDLSETKTRIRTPAQVVWSDDSGRAGIRFPKLPIQSLRQLRQWLFVNVLTAFDHARSETEFSEADEQSGSLLSQPEPYREASGVSEPSGKNGGLAGLKDMQRKVESGALSQEAALQLIAQQALAYTRAAGAAIALSEGDAMICVASAGSDAPPVGTPFQVGSGFSGECVRTGRSLRCDDSETDDRVDRQSSRVLGIRAMVAVPIRRGNRVAGLLEVFSPQPYAFNSQDISVLQQLTGTIQSAMDGGVEVSPAPVEIPKAPPMRMPAPRIESRRFEPLRSEPLRTESQPSSVFAGTMAAVERLPRPRSHKIVLAAAGCTFLFALLWLTTPWIVSQIGTIRSSAPVQQPSAAGSRSVHQAAEINDLAGLRKLAEQGDPAAQFALGARYATGEEVKQDYSEAVRWFTQAADRGHILAQATLGAYYWAGRGVAPDLTKAYFWSTLAQAGGDQASKYRVAVLTSRMSRSEILAAQQQANDWLHSHATASNAPISQ